MEIKTLAGVCIVKDNKILLLRQADSEKDGIPGGWGPPAGHGEEKEKLVDTAIRETKEECNLDVKLTGVVESGIYRISDGRNYLIVIFRGEAANLDNIKVDNSEVVDFRWVGEDELKTNEISLRHPILKTILINALVKEAFPMEVFTDIEIKV